MWHIGCSRVLCTYLSVISQIAFPLPFEFLYKDLFREVILDSAWCLKGHYREICHCLYSSWYISRYMTTSSWYTSPPSNPTCATSMRFSSVQCEGENCPFPSVNHIVLGLQGGHSLGTGLVHHFHPLTASSLYMLPKQNLCKWPAAS